MFIDDLKKSMDRVDQNRICYFISYCNIFIENVYQISMMTSNAYYHAWIYLPLLQKNVHFIIGVAQQLFIDNLNEK